MPKTLNLSAWMEFELFKCYNWSFSSILLINSKHKLDILNKEKYSKEQYKIVVDENLDVTVA